MDPDTDSAQKMGKDAPRPENMLQEAEWLNREELGHHLNFMNSLYYESSSGTSADDDTPDIAAPQGDS